VRLAPSRTTEIYPRILNASTDIKFVNTSMHGVGHIFVDKSFELFGFRPFVPVKEQQHPDPEFSTVKFPNPEEAGMSHIPPTKTTSNYPATVNRY
jgi:phosphomannomutase